MMLLSAVPVRYKEVTEKGIGKVDIRNASSLSERSIFKFTRTDCGRLTFGVSPINVVNLVSEPRFLRIYLESLPWPHNELPVIDTLLRKRKAFKDLGSREQARLEAVFLSACSGELPRRRDDEQTRAVYMRRVSRKLTPLDVLNSKTQSEIALREAIKQYCEMRIFVLPDYLEASYKVLEWLRSPEKDCPSYLPSLISTKSVRTSMHANMLRVYQGCMGASSPLQANATALAALSLLNGHYALHETDTIERTVGTHIELADAECAQNRLIVTLCKESTVSGLVASPDSFASLWAAVSTSLEMEHSSADWRFKGPTIMEHFTVETRLGRNISKRLEADFTTVDTAGAVPLEIFLESRLLQPDRARKLSDEQDPFLSPGASVLCLKDAMKLATLYVRKGKPQDRSASFTWPSLYAGTKRFYKLSPALGLKLRPDSKIAKWNLKQGMTLKTACKLLNKLPGTSCARQKSANHLKK
jgi:hypothetical protein